MGEGKGKETKSEILSDTGKRKKRERERERERDLYLIWWEDQQPKREETHICRGAIDFFDSRFLDSAEDQRLNIANNRSRRGRFPVKCLSFISLQKFAEIFIEEIRRKKRWFIDRLTDRLVIELIENTERNRKKRKKERKKQEKRREEKRREENCKERREKFEKKEEGKRNRVVPRWKGNRRYSPRAIKTAIKYHRVFTNERGVRWLQARTKPWNTHEEQRVLLHFGDRGPPQSRILTDFVTWLYHLARDRPASSQRNPQPWVHDSFFHQSFLNQIFLFIYRAWRRCLHFYLSFHVRYFWLNLICRSTNLHFVDLCLQTLISMYYRTG